MRKYLSIYAIAVFCLFSLQGIGQVLKPNAIITGRLIGESREVKNIPVSPPNSSDRNTEFENRFMNRNINNPNAKSKDGALQNSVPYSITPGATNAPVLTFDGLTAAQACACLPPDVNGCVGPNHFVQMVNVKHAVYSKTGTLLSGPTSFSAINPNADNSGDPVVLYDQMADRWVLMQFAHLNAANAGFAFSISKTPDPTGAYWNYYFDMGAIGYVFPDYPHIAIWDNAYLITAHEFSGGGGFLGGSFTAIDRNKMITGAATSTLINFIDGDYGFLAASLEGYKMPDATAEPMFWHYDSDEQGPADQLKYRTMHVDFTTPSLSTLSAWTYLPTATFDGAQNPSRAAIEERGTVQLLDDLGGHTMSRVVYRRFDTYESVIMNHTVNVSGTTPPADNTQYQSAIRWYELRRPNPATPWTIYQQSTYAPFGTGNGATGINGWNGSGGIDQRGNIAIEYSRSSKNDYPSIYYGTRLVTDAANTLGAENILYAGLGSQTSTSNRWGDYSALCADPQGDTLWITNEYYNSPNSSSAWRTRIGKFVIAAAPTSPTVHWKTGGVPVLETDAVTLVPGSTCKRYKDYTANLVIDLAPSSPVTVTLTTSGTATLGADYDLIYTSPIVLSGANMTVPVTIRVYDDGQNEAEEYAYIGYTLSGGNGVADTYNQLFQLTIFGKTALDLNSFLTETYGAAGNVMTQNFDAFASGALPQSGWAQTLVALTAGGTNPNNFIIGTAPTGGAFAGKKLYISNNVGTGAYAYTFPSGSSYTVATIRAESPIIDITGKGQVNVSFNWECVGEPSYDFGSLWYSFDGGTNWYTNGVMLQTTTASVQSASVNLPASVKDVPNLKIGFQFTADDNTGTQPPIAIDNVVVTAKPLSYTNPQIQTALNAGTAITFNFGPFATIHFYDTTTKKIMASITNNSSFNFGCTKVVVDRAGTGAVAFNDNITADFLASKTFNIIPENNDVSASYTIKLYYTEAEIAGWEAATGQSRVGMKMAQVVGSPISAVTPANQASYTININPATQGAFGTTGGVTYQATFSGISGGFGVGKPVAVIPVSLLSFKGVHIKGQGNKLIWVVTNQINVLNYELQFSVDGSSFNTIATVGPRPFNGSNLTYDNIHRNYITGNNFYRLKTVDIDNKVTYSNIVLINVHDNASVVIYPNPVADKLMLSYSGVNNNIQIDIINGLGQVVYTSKTEVANPIIIPVSNLSAGNYVLRITDGTDILNTKFVKQ
jgi:hypothetical protein